MVTKKGGGKHIPDTFWIAIFTLNFDWTDAGSNSTNMSPASTNKSGAAQYLSYETKASCACGSRPGPTVKEPRCIYRSVNMMW